MKQREKKRQSGFTLMELMIVVAILGILAAVAIPVYSSYVTRSKGSEAFTVLQGIREKEESFFAEFKRYTTNLPWQPFVPGGGCNNESVYWNLVPGNGADDLWLQLGFVPDGPTFYSYQVVTPYDAAGALTAQIPPANIGTQWNPNQRPWFYAEATGDINCDGEVARFFISSENKNVFHTDAMLNVDQDDTIY